MILSKKKPDDCADICLILEGTYPYVSGGVSTWTHELLCEQKNLSFHLLCILPPGEAPDRKYDVPENVKTITNIFLQQLPKGRNLPSNKKRKDFFAHLKDHMTSFFAEPSADSLHRLMDTLAEPGIPLGKKMLLESEESWEILTNIYNSMVNGESFLDFYWSLKTLLGSMYAILLGPIPNARAYHAVCTGYAGLFLARTHMETGKPCILTEHGIYTNERRIEIASSDWLDSPLALNLNITNTQGAIKKDLKNLWMNHFIGYSRICYDNCAEIVTLFEENKKFQIVDGADSDKLRVIPNGIDFERFSAIEKSTKHPPTIALIGRVVPIKDIITFINATARVKESIPDIKAYIMGPTDEDEGYYQECRDAIASMNLEDNITFTGKVRIDDYLGAIDILVLTSISEAQPLVLLEAGAVGIPSVTTNVGACSEIISGAEDEQPSLGEGGVVCQLSNPIAIADAVSKLFNNKEFYASCSATIKERVARFYNKTEQHKAYSKLYRNHVEKFVKQEVK